MVEFSVAVQGNVRRGYDAMLIKQNVCHGLPDRLRAQDGGVDTEEDAAPTNQIISFPQRRADDAFSRHVHNG